MRLPVTHPGAVWKIARMDDPWWPRAASLLGAAGPCDLGVLGVPTFRTSLSATGAHATPDAVRAALARFSTWSADHDADVSRVTWADFGNVLDPDGAEGEARTYHAVMTSAAQSRLLTIIGGDNSLTYAAAMGIWRGDAASGALITVDAHHDVRDPINGQESNGSPVRRLLEAGVPGERVVQIGISEFANSRFYYERVRDAGVRIVTRHELRERGVREVMREALERVSDAPAGVYVDLDVDVCDRSVAPGCPASVPGGITADELRRIAYRAAEHPAVRAIDITEIDATADVSDQRTVRLGALLLLESALGLSARN